MVRGRLRNKLRLLKFRFTRTLGRKISDIGFIRKISVKLYSIELAINPKKRKEMDEAIDRLVALKKAGKLGDPKPINPR